MKLLIDKHIAQADTAFLPLGEVIKFDSPVPAPSQLRDCDILLTRSVTRVDADLLHDSRVQFVGTATSGVDHVDLEYLTEQGIRFVAAPGSNARPVAEYVLSALCVLLEQRGLSFPDISVGIIGYGHVGSTLHGLLEVLGARCLLNDPPLAAAGHAADFRSLGEVLQADVVTLHVPLTHSGDWPTWQLLDAERLGRLRPGTILINTARGGVVDESALKSIQPQRDLDVVLDVWMQEPAIDVELLKQTALATPHIAGYSLDARLRATRTLHEAVARWCGVEPNWLVAGADLPLRRLKLPDADFDDSVKHAILANYDVRGDTAALRRIDAIAPTVRVDYFRSLRNEYVLRREFPAMLLQPIDESVVDADRYRQLGFQLDI